MARARDKPDAQLDVRDLTFRAYVDNYTDARDEAARYAQVMASLNRSLALAPHDLLTLRIVAEVNLCECLKAWAADNRPMEDIGLATLDRYLRQRPDDPRVLRLRYLHYTKHGRYQEALVLNDRLRTLDPSDPEFLRLRVSLLRQMGEVTQALALVPQLLRVDDHYGAQTVAAAVYFAAGDDTQAAQQAREALVRMSRNEQADSGWGGVALVLVAAEARAGRLDLARRAWMDFQSVVPNVKTLAQIKAWMHPNWEAPGGDAFWQALRKAGVEA